MRLIEEKVPSEKTYVIELTQSEVDALGSVIVDLVDPARECRVLYPVDGDDVKPTKRFVDTLTDFAIFCSPESENYDYFDWFESVDS